jgi:hypothetical protein
MSFGEWLQLAWWDIQAAGGDLDAANHAAALRQVNAQATPEDKWIYQTVESEQIQHEGFLGDLEASIKSFWANLRKVISIFPWIVIGLGAVILFFFIFYYLPKKQKA